MKEERENRKKLELKWRTRVNGSSAVSKQVISHWRFFAPTCLTLTCPDSPCDLFPAQMWNRWLKQQQVFWGDLWPLRSFICLHCRSSHLQLPHFSVAPHLLSPSACSNLLQSPLYFPCTLSLSSILFPPSLYLQGLCMLTAFITTSSTSIRTLPTSQKSLTLFSPECPSMLIFIHDSRRNLQCHTVDF